MDVLVYLLISFWYGVSAKTTENVTLLFVGDVSFAGPIRYYVEHKYHSYNDTLSEIAPYVREADISVANLESPFINKDMYNSMYDGEKTVILDASPEAAPALSFAGFDAVTLANNHLNDFGSEGANNSVKVLKKTGIQYFGISFGKYNSPQEPLILERKGIKIGFLGYCDTPSPTIKKNCTEMRMLFNSGPAIYGDDIATRDVQHLKKAKVGIIVVMMHYGQELFLTPLPYQRRINKHLMSLGVHVIIGSHPHVLQPCYVKHRKLVAYSLGNFLFHPSRTPSGNSPKTYGRLGEKPNQYKIEAFEHLVLENSGGIRASQMLKVTVSRGGVVDAKYLPLKIAFDLKRKRIHPTILKDAEWITVCRNMDKRQIKRNGRLSADDLIMKTSELRETNSL